MGHSSKKKKKRGSGGRKISLKDHGSFTAENSELINDELTALCAIFQEDCKVVSESPPQVSVKLRPYSKDTGYENSDISAFLSIRFLQGYPNKCPKVQIIPEKGLSEVDADKLLSLLLDQANYNSREGRVMIYNLVEAAQEFLSEIVPMIPYEVFGQTSQLHLQGEAVSCATFVNVHVDLFSASGESWHWNLGMGQNTDSSSSLYSNTKEESKLIHRHVLNKMEQKALSIPAVDGKQELQRKSALNVITVNDGSEDERKSTTDSSRTLSSESVDMFVVGDLTESSDNDSVPSQSFSSEFSGHNGSSQTMKTDFIMAHLLRLACASKGSLADALPQITSELYDLGIVGEHVRDLALKPSSLFDRTFSSIFGQEMVSSTSSPFWRTYADFGGEQSLSMPNSRYLSDFEEIQPLGQGGFGHVVLCKNKLDGRQYAMKKIRLKDKSVPDRILREVATLSRLQHQHVVRYYQAWFETGIPVSHGDLTRDSRTAESSNFSYKDGSSYDNFGPDNKFNSTYLYIQMEYCPRTLREMFESYNHFDKELAWHLFRQIVEGLAHIHSQGIIHRDLTPSNIFFDARNDIKIGDFGLAKFLKLEQMEQDVDVADVVGISLDGTGQVGTYFYTAPEIEQGWPKIDEKADMYSLGVVFLELWHPFDTAMERHVVLSELKQKGGLPSTWANEFPEQASLLKRLMSPSPSDRPSATELLQNAFPPRMEFELLDNILRTIHTSEDTSLYDKIVHSVFDEESLRTKDHHEGVSRLKLVGSDTSSFLLPDTNTAIRDHVIEVATKVFRQHCAKRLEILPMHLLGDNLQYTRSRVKLLTQGGDMVELCHELRLPFVQWVIENQKLFFKRYEISNVYRRAIGHSPPSRYLQGDFDIIGGATALTDAETIKATIEIIGHFFHLDSCDIHLNHGGLLEALWNWAGILPEHWQKVAELLSLLTSLHPQSPERKSKWVVVRRQLRQELNLPEVVVNRLQTVGLRFCGDIDQTLPRLRGALPEDKSTRRALDELSELFNYLRVWRINSCVFVDALMPPTEYYHKNIFFQVYLRKIPGSLSEGTLLAIGGRYDFLLQTMGDSHKANLPGGVGSSLALETILSQSISVDGKHHRIDAPADILVCSRGGGGLLTERMEIVAELWEENIKAEFVPVRDPSLTEQYEYANEHNIKCLVIITGASQTDSVKVRHIELKKEKGIERENLVKFLSAAVATQFRNPALWN